MRATDIKPRELTREDVLEHLINFAWDVYDHSRDERLRGRAGSIIDAYVPDWISQADCDRIHQSTL